MEFKNVMSMIKAAAESPENMALLHRGESWLYSWDNDKVHRGADLAKVGFTEADRFDLPELSSDMHKVVEHVHAWLDRKMQQWLEARGDAAVDIDEAMEELKRLFMQCYPKSAVQKDVDSLKETYKAVVDAGGGFVAAKHR